jgi:hypothetical protein
VIQSLATPMSQVLLFTCATRNGVWEELEIIKVLENYHKKLPFFYSV